MRAFAALSLLLAVILSGCAHTRLSCNATKQARTLTEIEEQQVLDNIAMFVANCGSTPYFALPNGGGTLTNQAATVSSTLLWSPRTLTSENGTLSGTAGLTVNWTLKPINEPERLELMKRLYQHVTNNFPNPDCKSDEDLMHFLGVTNLTDACDVPSGWFSVSDKKPRNKNCCCKVGHYCGTYVCVSEEYFEYLSLVTVAILDIATADSVALASRLKGPQDPTVQIEETFNVEGKDGTLNKMVKGTRKVTVAEYAKMKGEKIAKQGDPPSANFPQPKRRPWDLPENIRPRRESGSSFESLQQLNLSR